MLTKLKEDLRAFRTTPPSVSEITLGKTHCQDSTPVIFCHRRMTVIMLMDSSIQHLIAQSFARSFSIR